MKILSINILTLSMFFYGAVFAQTTVIGGQKIEGNNNLVIGINIGSHSSGSSNDISKILSTLSRQYEKILFSVNQIKQGQDDQNRLTLKQQPVRDTPKKAGSDKSRDVLPHTETTLDVSKRQSLIGQSGKKRKLGDGSADVIDKDEFGYWDEITTVKVADDDSQKKILKNLRDEFVLFASRGRFYKYKLSDNEETYSMVSTLSNTEVCSRGHRDYRGKLVPGYRTEIFEDWVNPDNTLIVFETNCYEDGGDASYKAIRLGMVQTSPPIELRQMKPVLAIRAENRSIKGYIAVNGKELIETDENFRVRKVIERDAIDPRDDRYIIHGIFKFQGGHTLLYGIGKRNVSMSRETRAYNINNGVYKHLGAGEFVAYDPYQGGVYLIARDANYSPSLFYIDRYLDRVFVRELPGFVTGVAAVLKDRIVFHRYNLGLLSISKDGRNESIFTSPAGYGVQVDDYIVAGGSDKNSILFLRGDLSIIEKFNGRCQVFCVQGVEDFSTAPLAAPYQKQKRAARW